MAAELREPSAACARTVPKQSWLSSRVTDERIRHWILGCRCDTLSARSIDGTAPVRSLLSAYLHCSCNLLQSAELAAYYYPGRPVFCRFALLLRHIWGTVAPLMENPCARRRPPAVPSRSSTGGQGAVCSSGGCAWNSRLAGEKRSIFLVNPRISPRLSRASTQGSVADPCHRRESDLFRGSSVCSENFLVLSI